MGKPIFQKHHCVYPDSRNKPVIRKIRKGVHQYLTLLRRFNYLTDQEINATMLECELRRTFEEKDGRSSGDV